MARREGRKEAQMRSRSSHVFPLTDRASSYAIEGGDREVAGSECGRASKCHPPFSAVELPAFRFFVRPSVRPSISITSSHPWAMADCKEQSCGWPGDWREKEGLGYEIAGLCDAPSSPPSQRERKRLSRWKRGRTSAMFKDKHFLILLQPCL